MRPRDGVSGFSLVELVVSLTILALLLASFIPGLVRMSRVLELRLARSDWVDAVRIVSNLLEDELAGSLPGRDWAIEANGGLQLRAFRGLARPCAPDGEGGWWVQWQGERIPDPARDSVLVFSAQGTWEGARLLLHESAGATAGGIAGQGGGCALDPGSRLVRWRWDGIGVAQQAPILLRVFESGRYGIEDRAFRYRRGQTGARNPLTLEVFANESRWVAIPGGLEVHLYPRPSGVQGVGAPDASIRFRVLTPNQGATVVVQQSVEAP